MKTPVLAVLSAALLAFASCRQEKKADFFERDAREYTEKNCPQRLDPYTTLDSIVYHKNEPVGELTLYYTLQLSLDEREEMMKKVDELEAENRKIVRNSIVFAKYKEARTTFTYVYHDAEKGDKIVEFHYTKEDYE